MPSFLSSVLPSFTNPHQSTSKIGGRAAPPTTPPPDVSDSKGNSSQAASGVQHIEHFAEPCAGLSELANSKVSLGRPGHLSCPTLCYPVLPCATLCYPVLPCATLSYPVLPCATLGPAWLSSQPGRMRRSRPRPRAVGATNCATHTATKTCNKAKRRSTRKRAAKVMNLKLRWPLSNQAFRTGLSPEKPSAALQRANASAAFASMGRLWAASCRCSVYRPNAATSRSRSGLQGETGFQDGSTVCVFRMSVLCI